MRLTKLRLKNFRSFKSSQTLEFSPLTMLFGPNSVGKSSVLMALAYVQQILTTGQCNPQHLDALNKKVGGFQSLVNGNDLEKTMVIEVEFEVGTTIFEEYRNLLTQNKRKEVDDGYRDAAQLIQNEDGNSPYVSVVVDEAQDMSTQAYHLIRQLVSEGPNDLFIVGDGHQRIYGRNKVVLSQCGINIRGRARKLRLNYRTTEEIRKWAVNLLEGFPVDDLDGGMDDNRGYKSLAHGMAPQIESFDSLEQQAGFIASYLNAIKSNNQPLHHICIVARVRKELDAIREYLSQASIASEEITGESSGSDNPATVNLATMHRVKGIEFDEVILASVNEGVVPFGRALEGKGDAVEKRQADLEERALVYVAMTRAKKKLIITSYGQESSYLSIKGMR